VDVKCPLLSSWSIHVAQRAWAFSALHFVRAGLLNTLQTLPLGGASLLCSMPPALLMGPPPALPAPARTHFTLLVGDPIDKVEDRVELPTTSPMVTSLPFLDWSHEDGPPAISSTSRSAFMVVLLQGSRRPSLLDISQLEELPFISTEVNDDEARIWAFQYDSSGAWNIVHSSFETWKDNAVAFALAANNPAALILTLDSFASWIQLCPWIRLGAFCYRKRTLSQRGAYIPNLCGAPHPFPVRMSRRRPLLPPLCPATPEYPFLVFHPR
jgi:hypothetical protein